MTSKHHTRIKGKIHTLAILYKRGPVKTFFHKINTISQNKNNKITKIKTEFYNPTQIVGFHLQGLQTVAFVLAWVSGMLDSRQAGRAPQSSL